MTTSGSRAEFLAVDALGSTSDIKYDRTGGWFVSTRRALLLCLLVIASMVLVGVLVHYLATCKGLRMGTELIPVTEASVATPNTPKDGAESSISAAELRLPKDVTPSHYRLRLEPYLEDADPDGKNFTYNGHVSITIQCHRTTNRVSIHAKNLDIGKDVKVAVAAPRNSGATSETAVRTLGNTTPNPITTTPGGLRRKRSLTRNHHRRRQRTVTSTAPPGLPPRVTGCVPEVRKEMYVISVEPSLEPGLTYTLDIPFKGLLKESLFGFYRSSYKDENDTKIWMAPTQFEPTHAREAFPCFDEPAMKARFEISIARRRDDMITLSNMPVRVTEPIEGQPGRVWDHYEITPKTSTYLVAFIVAHSDFIPTNDTGATYLNPRSRNTTVPEFRVYARRQLIQTAQYASSIGPRVLDFYGEYFGMPYPLPKLHMAAIPDFSLGAMENWGLLTYRETNLLFDPKSSSMSSKEGVAIVVAHELAHQWFGNLVTMKWWNDLWLNEGFATYMEYLGSDHVEPSWAMLDKFLVYEQQPAMALDGLRSTHPVSTTVDNPSQISEIFDYVSYSKGASLIRMLNNSLTEEVLRKGLTRYLNKWKYSNAEENDLWQVLTEETLVPRESSLPENVTVRQVMDTWTLQDGYPVLSVTRDYDDGSANLSQTRFTLDNSSSDTTWYIPVSYVTQNEMNDAANSSRITFPRIWLKKEPTTVVHDLTKNNSYDTWVLFNIYATGYYRVNYDTRNWGLLAEHLLNPPTGHVFPAVTRAQLLDDALNLARAGILGYDVALNMTQYLATGENHYVPWTAAFQNFKFLDLILRQTTAYGCFQKYILKTLAAVTESLGIEATTTETQLQSLLRPDILAWLSKMDDPEVVRWAKNLFQLWTTSSKPDTENPVRVDVRGVVYCTAVKTGGTQEWDFVLKRYLAAANRPSESDVLLMSLACSRQEWLIVTLLEKSLESGGEIRLQDVSRLWDNMASRDLTSRLAFRYIQNKWSSIFEKYGKDEYLMGDILHGAISGLSTEFDLTYVREFYSANKGKFSFAERKIEQELEGLELRVGWHNRSYGTVASWLQNHQGGQKVKRE